MKELFVPRQPVFQPSRRSIRTTERTPLTEGLPFAAEPCSCRAMAECHSGPQNLSYDHCPGKARRKMPRDQEPLIAGDQPDSGGMPGSERSTAQMPCMRRGYIHAGIIQPGTTHGKLDVFQIRFKPFVQRADFGKQLRTEQCG